MIIANFIPLEEPGGGPNYKLFSDNVLYEIKLDRNNDGYEDLAFQFRFTTRIQTAGTFLNFLGPIDKLTTDGSAIVTARAITIVLPAPGDTAGAEMAGLGTGCGGFELRAGGAGGFDGAEKAGAMTGFAFGFARMVLTCSMSFALSNGFGICPFAPTAIALAGSMGAGPPSSSTGTSFNEASPRTR